MKVQKPHYEKLLLSPEAKTLLWNSPGCLVEGASVLLLDDPDPSPKLPHSVQYVTRETYNVTLGQVPPGLTAVLVPVHFSEESHCRLVRTESEGPGPNEYEGSWFDRGDFVPCPKCGSALVWYEAGYVPGYRICLKGHHAQLSGDGRSAEYMEGGE